VFNPIPINVQLQERNSKGDIVTANNGITLTTNGWGAGGSGRYTVGTQITLVFAKTQNKKTNIAEEAAQEQRYQLVSSLDRGSAYQLGTARFALLSITDNTNLDDNEVRATFRCIAAGRTPSTPYGDSKAPENGAKDDSFYTKALVKADSAAYQTVTACEMVSFSMRVKLFRRIQGRQKKYGDSEPEGYKASDNGIKSRLAFFRLLYRPLSRATQDLLPLIIACRRSADLDNFISLDFRAGSGNQKWEFEFQPISDLAAERAQNGQKQIALIENSGKGESFRHNGNRFRWVGDLKDISSVLKDRGPVLTNEWDLFSVRSDTDIQFSFEAGPEFQITAVTEQQLRSTEGKYARMSTMAFGVFSGRGVQDLRSISAFVTEGKDSWVVSDDGTYSKSAGSTSWAPDIFADTVLDKENGIGRYAKPSGVDWQSLALSKRFCQYSGLGCQLFMDPLIAEVGSWRQFWAEVAPYSLLEFGKIGGKETLVPAVPVNSSGRANRRVNISALFTTGNILEGTYREEFLDYGASVQDLIATVIYRETEEDDVFPRNASVDVRLVDAVEDAAIRQTFDLSQFVTQRKQAILYGKLLCNQRRWVRRGIEFQTFPTDTPVSPGAYIYVDVGLNTWDRMTAGVVTPGGVLNAPLSDRIRDGTYAALVYRSGGNVRSLASVTVADGKANALSGDAGAMFVLGAVADRRRVFRVTEVTMSEEGEVTVKALEHPCETVDGNLLSRVANFSDEIFAVDAMGDAVIVAPPLPPEPPEPEELEELVIWYDEEDAQVFPAGAVTLVKNVATGDYGTTTHLGQLAFAAQEGDDESSYSHDWQIEIPDETLSGDFTIEFWARAAIISPPLGSVGSSIVQVQSDNGFGLNMSHSAQWDDYENPGTPEENNQIDFRLIQDTDSGLTLNRAGVYESFGSSVQGWKHACFQRINGQNVFHYDGDPLVLTQTDGTMPTPGLIPLNAVLSFTAFNAEPFTNSAIGQIRISNSARYGTGSFTPPTEAFYVPTP
jgi:hypothetical protein